jgi:F-type H+-transporting ATPase subunit b
VYRSSPPPSSAPRASFDRHALPLAPPRPWLTVFPASRVSRFFPSSSKVELPKSVKPAVIAAVTNALVAMPSMAGEPGKIFDFNLTLPIIATEFLLLMVILDKTIFGPVGKALDDRDALIRDQLAAVGDNSTAVADLIAEKEALISSARAEVAKEVAATKAKMDADIAEASAKAKADVDRQIAAAIAKLDAAKAESAAQVETKATELSNEIINKVVNV